MRHKMRGRKLGRNGSHRKAMFRNMAASLIKTVVADREQNATDPHVPGRIVTTVHKAKELRPFVERLITIAKKAQPHLEAARQHGTTAQPRSEEYAQWRKSDAWQEWNQAIAPAVALRRRAFSLLRDKLAVDVLFDELAERFADRPGGYTRIVRLAKVRLGDAGVRALIEFVGENDRKKVKRRAAPTVAAPVAAAPAPAAEPVADEAAESADAPSDEAAEEPQAEG
jgi:large subunit ribosomal protein L17